MKVLVFDLDGTLLNTIDDIMYCANQALLEEGLTTYNVNEYKQMVGEGVDKLIERCLLNQQASLELFDKIKLKYLAYYQTNGTTYTKPYDGILDVLDYANKHQIKCCVFSNKPHHDTVSVIHHYFPKDSFAKVYGKMEGYLPKPNPQKLLEMLKELKVDTSEVLYFGDTLTDMLTAQNASLKKVGVLWGFRDLNELKKGKPEYIIEYPNQIIDILEGKIK